MNVSIFYGKPIESTAGKKGYVISVRAAADKLKCLICADENEKEFAVDVKNIIKIGDKIVYEDRDDAIKNSYSVRLGCAGFDESGRYLGNVEEITFKGDKLLKAKIGAKTYSAETLTYGDVIIVKKVKKLKYDVVKDGKVLFGKGTAVTREVLTEAELAGEYVQTNLKTI